VADFTLPELGENISAGDVLNVLVKVGDTLAKDQPVLELETDKATIEVPSSVAGVVKEIKVKAGEKVKVGQAILSYEEAAGAAAPKAAPAQANAPAAKEGAKQTQTKAEPAKAADAGAKAAAPAKAAVAAKRPATKAKAAPRKR